MRNRLTNLLVGALLGTVLAQGIPAVAHFSDSTTPKHEYKHVKALERRIRALEIEIEGECCFLLPGLKTRVSSLEEKTKVIEGKTRNLDSLGELDGTYVDAPSGCDGDPATWEYSGSLGC